MDSAGEISLLSAVNRYNDIYETWLSTPFSETLHGLVEISFEGEDTILITCKNSSAWHQLKLSEETIGEWFDKVMRRWSIKKIELRRE